ncbi:MAG: O-antigen ligase family protein [Proteobacteria bacterium]|nr:O-antigen ligase family protein [Pseudomonadota bacterium]
MLEFLVAAYAALALGGDILGLLHPSLPVRASAVVSVGLVVAVLLERRGDASANSVPAPMVVWGVMAAWCAASLAWSADLAATQRVVGHLGKEVVLLGALALAPRRGAVLRSVVRGGVAGGAALALGLIATLLLAEPTARRLVVGLGDANFQGRQLALALVLAVAVGRREAWAAIALIGLALGLSGSRGAWLATAGALAVAVWPGAPQIRRRLAAVAVLATVVGAVLILARPDVREPLPHADREALTSGRDAIWLNTLDIILDHPELGVGAGAVPAVYTPYRDARMGAGGLHSKPARDPHSHYLQLAAETGPIGLFLFVLGLVLALRGAPRPALAVLVLAALGAATVSTIEQKAFWLALAWGALRADVGSRPSG